MKYANPKNSRSHRSRIFSSRTTLIALAAFALLTLATTSVFMAVPLNGAIFTTNVSCDGTNINIFTDKDAVYLDGGPAHPGAAGLPDGSYYVQVTEPGGALLGTSVGTGNPTPVSVLNGSFLTCYQLSSIVNKASDLSSPGYDDTTNGGGEYKVWVSPTSTFDQAKTDNFKVKPGEPVPPQGDINVLKFYDANANGINDDGQLITGWKVRIQDSIDFIRFTPVAITVFAPDDYTVTEFDPNETNWVHTTANPVAFSLGIAEVKNVEFGNLCLGPGGGLTLGFWSNKNGAKIITNQNLLSAVLGQCLRKGDGSLLGNVNLATFQSFLTSANASNMANMLSAQLAAMKLNVLSGGVNGGALIYAPGTNSANALGYATVNAVMTEANTLLCSGGSNLLILSGNPDRPRAEALKTALDKANNNLTFVQGSPCPFTF